MNLEFDYTFPILAIHRNGKTRTFYTEIELFSGIKNIDAFGKYHVEQQYENYYQVIGYKHHDWILRDDQGLILDPSRIKRFLKNKKRSSARSRLYEFQKKQKDHSVNLGLAVCGIHKRYSYGKRYFRYPRTLQENRASKSIAQDKREQDMEFMQMNFVKTRSVRNKLPTACDDQSRHFQKSWKSYRDFQWKNQSY